jgi:hypothetical protein
MPVDLPRSNFAVPMSVMSFSSWLWRVRSSIWSNHSTLWMQTEMFQVANSLQMLPG